MVILEVYPEDHETGAVLVAEEDLVLGGLRLVERPDDPEAYLNGNHPDAPSISSLESLLDPLNDESTQQKEPKTQIKRDGLLVDSLNQFMGLAGQYELLTAAQEIELAKRIESGRAAKEKLELPRSPSKKLAESTVANLEALQADGQQAHDLMVNSNLRLVISIVK